MRIFFLLLIALFFVFLAIQVGLNLISDGRYLGAPAGNSIQEAWIISYCGETRLYLVTKELEPEFGYTRLVLIFPLLGFLAAVICWGAYELIRALMEAKK